MKRLFAAVLLALALALSSFGQETCNRHVEALGGFSVCVPEGWAIADNPATKFKVFKAPVTNLGANMAFAEESFIFLPLDKYADLSIKNTLAIYNNQGATEVALLSRTDFVTDEKIKAVKLKYSVEVRGLPIVTVQYIFDASPKKLVLSASAFEPKIDESEPLFDATAKTFQVIKKPAKPKPTRPGQTRTRRG